MANTVRDSLPPRRTVKKLADRQMHVFFRRRRSAAAVASYFAAAVNWAVRSSQTSASYVRGRALRADDTTALRPTDRPTEWLMVWCVCPLQRAVVFFLTDWLNGLGVSMLTWWVDPVAHTHAPRGGAQSTRRLRIINRQRPMLVP